jgi:hypothetical protein
MKGIRLADLVGHSFALERVAGLVWVGSRLAWTQGTTLFFLFYLRKNKGRGKYFEEAAR